MNNECIKAQRKMRSFLEQIWRVTVLSEKQETVLGLRYEGYSWKYIGDRFGVTRDRAKQIFGESIVELKEQEMDRGLINDLIEE